MRDAPADGPILLVEDLPGPLEGRVEVLRGFHIWHDVSEEVLREIAAAAQPERFDIGDYLIRQGYPGSHFRVLVSGSAEVRVHGDSGIVVTVATLHAGEVLGEMSLLTGELTSADVIAAETCHTLSLDRETFHGLVASKPKLLWEFVRMVSRRLRSRDQAVASAQQKEQDISGLLQEQMREEDLDLVGSDTTTRKLRKQAWAEAQRDGSLLIQGERGTGKKFLAGLIHMRSERRDKPLLRVHCAQLNDTPWGDRLFGNLQAAAASQRTVSYLDLAAGGTLVLEDIGSMPHPVQKRLARFLDAASYQDPARPNVRVVATCRGSFGDLEKNGLVIESLAELLASRVLTIPPLRERKRDIADLANLYAQRQARRLGKQIEPIDDSVLRKLLTYDYRLGNAQELTEAVERAVILTDEGRILPEQVFLGPPPARRLPGLNLLQLPRELVVRGLRFFPVTLQVLSALVYFGLLAACLLWPGEPPGRFALAGFWAVAWPALSLSVFLAGRITCAVCPMAFTGSLLQRLHLARRKVPAWLKRNDTAFVTAGFFLIMWAEEAFLMRSSCDATAVLLLVILACALVGFVLFPRRAWCRHMCPLGGFVGLCATSGVLELRPTVDVCAGKCKGHHCYTGTDEQEGCPMFNHVMFLDSSQHCVLCMKCVQTCPNSSPQALVRFPHPASWNGPDATPQTAAFVAMLLGLIPALLVLQYLEFSGHLHGLPTGERLGLVSLLLASCAAAPVLAVLVMAGRLRRDQSTEEPRAVPWKMMTAAVPLLAAAFAGYQLAFVPGLSELSAGLNTGGTLDILTVSLVSGARVLLLTAGLFATVGVLRRLGKTSGPTIPGRWLDYALTGVLLYAAVVAGLMLRPSWFLG
ncbi:MAG: sigma 54-interacting transcriptional regulator [Armatimonadetes bacterium]|nr:sigma 54-interacting transcriptional regulator [Armatimonadota bacterium]